MIGIIDYGVGNLGSVANALEILGTKYLISADPKVLLTTKALILPGDGAAPEGMKNLKKNGLDKMLLPAVQKNKPFLGICLGMQLLLTFSQEGAIPCLNIIKGDVKKFTGKKLKIPQIGWNQVKINKLNNKKNIFKGIPDNSYFYFVDSYYCDPQDKKIITGTTEYGLKFCSALQKNNIYALQFHPEKSGDLGIQLLKNFLMFI